MQKFEEQAAGSKILLKRVPDPNRFGVPVLHNGRIIRIEEKQTHPRSSYAVTGIYLYDGEVFDIIRTLRPSPRGELDITDVNNIYLKCGLLTYDISGGWWSDAGTFESLHRASNLVARTGANKMEGRVIVRRRQATHDQS